MRTWMLEQLLYAVAATGSDRGTSPPHVRQLLVAAWNSRIDVPFTRCSNLIMNGVARDDTCSAIDTAFHEDRCKVSRGEQ